jgi:primosomal protein N' (replication factor Y)
MSSYLEIAVNVAQVSGVFHYHLPEHLEGKVGSGHLVIVPFGKQRVQGVVLRSLEQPEAPYTRAVEELVDPAVVLTAGQLALARHLAESTLAPLSACIGLMVPAGLSQLADTLYSRLPAQPSGRPISALQQRLLTLLERRGPLRGRQIDQAMPRLDWRPLARGLLRRGLLKAQSVLPPPSVQPKAVRTAQLACPPEQARAALPGLGKAGSQVLARRQAMLTFLLKENGPVDVSWAYAASGGNLTDLRALAERGLVSLGESQVWRDPLMEVEFIPAEPPPLTGDQEIVWAELQAGLADAAAGQPVAPYLLHGVTGSGKTEIYLRAVEAVLQGGKQAIVLVPEIALTPQTVRRFLARFPGQVGLVHSRLSAGERYDTWRRARLGLLKVVVGPRSALFTPFPQIGLIVVDECHDDSYYQEESQPYHHAREAAVTYAGLVGALCLLGSATPDLLSQHRAHQGQWHYLQLPVRILAHRRAIQAQLERSAGPPQPADGALRPLQAGTYHYFEKEAAARDLPPVQVADMRQELKAGNRSIFSRALQAALTQTLEAGQQAILFLNRRGAATYIFCRDCGYSLKCPRCELPLTYHASSWQAGQLAHPADEPAGAGQTGELPKFLPTALPAEPLICHRCGYKRKMPLNCPGCGSRRIRQYGAGTERVEAEVQALLPQARTLRWDSETTRQKGAHEIILSHFANRRADILVGTQMLAKGLDMPLVTLVGVVLADIGLNLPDYRAAERTFQLLTQVAGRAGRSPLGGQVILQTFMPEHYAIQAAARHDAAGFYAQELAYRQQLGYPPYTRLVRLEYRHPEAAQAEAAAHALAAHLLDWIESADRRATRLIGPAPCFFSRIGGLARWQIVLRGPDPASLLRNRPLAEWKIEVDPVSLL